MTTTPQDATQTPAPAGPAITEQDVADLLAAITEAQSARYHAEYCGCWRPVVDLVVRLAPALPALLAAHARAGEDAVRLDWLEARSLSVARFVAGRDEGRWQVRHECYDSEIGEMIAFTTRDTLREAVDAARAATPEVDRG